MADTQMNVWGLVELLRQAMERGSLNGGALVTDPEGRPIVGVVTQSLLNGRDTVWLIHE
jgi:hypothetical protein